MDGKTVTKTNKEVLTIWNVLIRLVEQPLPPKTAYTLKRNAEEIFKIIKIIVAKREELIRKHGTPDPVNKTITVKKENNDYFNELEDYLAKTVEFTIREIETSKIINSAEIPLPATDFATLDFMLCEDKTIIELGSDHPSLIH